MSLAKMVLLNGISMHYLRNFLLYSFVYSILKIIVGGHYKRLKDIN